LLPALAQDMAPVDLFVHDGDHSYAGQFEEYHNAWPHLAAGGSLVSDDVHTPAFTDFAAEVGARPYLIAPPRHNAAVGFLVKYP
ncbi:MAG: class I SAM-dependent methyltransferase, partial [Acidimicrobiales bacterium]